MGKKDTKVSGFSHLKLMVAAKTLLPATNIANNLN
jgi:hypothetical protein